MKLPVVIFLILFGANNLFGQSLNINEFLAVNDTAIADQNGEYDDWIEIYNSGDSTISLLGYYLSDDNNLTRWAFPDTSILSHGYIVVWADDDAGQAGLHANFKLSAYGEAVYLVKNGTAIIDSITFGPQMIDISMGRYPDGSGLFRYMYPTFSAANRGDQIVFPDSSNFVFNDSIVHRFNLHFYTPNWQDSLKHYFEDLDKEYFPARLTFDDSLVLDSIGVRYKGNSSYTLSRNTIKKPIKFSFNKYRDNQTLYGLHRMNLHNSVSDPSFMREVIAYDIIRNYLPAPRTAYANLYVEGELIGIYVMVEQIDKIFIQKYFENNAYNLYKAGSDGAALTYLGEDQEEYEDLYKLKTNEDENDWSRLIEMIDRLNNTSRWNFEDTMSHWLNIDWCLRLLAFNMVISNFDSYTGSGRNFYFYDNMQNGQFHVIPWDLNESFGVYTGGWDVLTQDLTNIPNLNQRPLNRRLLENDSLQQVYLNYIAQMSTGPASYDTVASMANRIYPLVDSCVQADTNKLYTYQNFVDNIESDVYVDLRRLIPGIKSFSRARNENIALQLTYEKVFPGDIDNNGVVNALDILPVGVYFLTTGENRYKTSYYWQPWRLPGWNNLAAMYADANGDGTIDERDIIAIGVNWGNTHSVTGRPYAIDLINDSLIEFYGDNFKAIYNSLSGESAPIRAMKALLDSLFDGTLIKSVPTTYSIDQNYPNPFNLETVIKYSIPEKQNVTITIYNLLGQILSRPVDWQLLEPGEHLLHLDGSNMSTGIYFYRIETRQGNIVCKMTIIK
jgi:hypothetical protein